LKVVTDQDIRDDLVYQLVTKHTLSYPLSDLDERMEVQLHVKTHVEGEGAAAFNLVVNHKHCVAAYERSEIKDENVQTFDPNTRMKVSI
jgi:hypothetical protein